MPTYTTNLHLKKPATTDQVNINDINDNMDAIDDTYTYVNITDFNDFVPTGTATRRVYGQCSGGTASNAPVLTTSGGDSATFRGYVEGGANYFTQHFTVEYAATPSNRGRSFIRTYINGNFGKWMELQNAYPTIVVAGGGSTTFTLSAWGQCIVTVIGYAESATGAFLLARNQGTLVKKSLGTAPSDISMSMDSSTGVVTLTNSNGNGVLVRIERYRDGLTV